MLIRYACCWWDYSVAKLCPTLCNPTNYSMPGFPVLHYIPEFAQTHVHWISDAIQPSYSLMPLLHLPSIFPIIRVFSRESALCDPMNCSTLGLPVDHQLPESTQTHVHWVGDAIQRSHPLSPLLLLPLIFPSIRIFSNESALHIRWPKYWHFSLSISTSMNIQGWSPCCPRDFQESSPAPLFESINFSAFSFLNGPIHICTWLLEKP